MKVGFIGYGKFAKIRQRCFVESEYNDIEIIGFFDPNITKGDIKKFSNIDDLISSVDTVVISTPPKFSPKYVNIA